MGTVLKDVVGKTLKITFYLIHAILRIVGQMLPQIQYVVVQLAFKL